VSAADIAATIKTSRYEPTRGFLKVENLVTKTALHHRVVNTECVGGGRREEDSSERNHREFALSNEILTVHEIHLAAALA